MNIVVLLKQTFDTEEKVLVRDGNVQEENVEFIINPYDEYAVEEAIKLKETHGGEVSVVSLGPERVEKALRTALAMGADKAVLIDDPALFGDEHAISYALAAAVKKTPFDIVLAGNLAIDDGAGQSGARVAELLDIPQITTVTKLQIEGRKVTAERDAEGDLEIIEAQLPVLVTAQQGLNEPRYPSLPGIMKAKKKPLERLSAADLGVNLEEAVSRTELLHTMMPPQKQGGKLLQGETSEQAKELVRLLRHEAKVI